MTVVAGGDDIVTVEFTVSVDTDSTNGDGDGTGVAPADNVDGTGDVQDNVDVTFTANIDLLNVLKFVGGRSGNVTACR